MKLNEIRQATFVPDCDVRLYHVTGITAQILPSK